MKWLFAETCHFLHKSRRQISPLYKIYRGRSLSLLEKILDVSISSIYLEWIQTSCLYLKSNTSLKGNKFPQWDASLSRGQKSKATPIGCNFVIPRYLFFTKFEPSSHLLSPGSGVDQGAGGHQGGHHSGVHLEQNRLCCVHVYSVQTPPSRPSRAPAAPPACYPPRGRPRCRSRLKIELILYRRLGESLKNPFKDSATNSNVYGVIVEILYKGLT